VAAGAVAIGGEHTGIYSMDSPGGWNIIGHTEVALVKTREGIEAREGHEVFFLKPGDQVQFVACHVR
jgi:inhibitor of KinA